jgi:tetratricopeptide (TPR) repeat protein
MASEDAEQQIRDLNQQVEDFYHQGNVAAALELARRVCELARRELGDNNPDTATSLNNLGFLLRITRDLAAARPYLEQAVKINRCVRGDDHPNTAISLRNLGRVLKEMGKLVDARYCYEEVLKICRRVMGDETPETVTTDSSISKATITPPQARQPRPGMHSTSLAGTSNR